MTQSLTELERRVLDELQHALKRLGCDPLYYEVGIEELRDSTGYIDRVLNIPASYRLCDALNAWTAELAKNFDWDEYYNPGHGGDY